MVRTSFVSIVGLLFAGAGAVVGNPVQAPASYTSKNNRLDCPYAHASKWTGPENGKWGILCGMDTQSTTYFKGPIMGVTFEECILKCGGANFDCNIATYTAGSGPGEGTCYLKKSAKGLGYKKTGNKAYRVAIFLEEGKKAAPKEY